MGEGSRRVRGAKDSGRRESAAAGVEPAPPLPLSPLAFGETPSPARGEGEVVRIIAGQWRGRPLLAPPGLATRPTSDRAREGLFSMLTSRLGSFEGLRVADLFAGSGALGLEALSRGAAYCLFVEKDRAAADILRANVEKLGAADRADIRVQPAEHALPPVPPADLILADPPYATSLAQALLDRIGQGGWLAPGGWLSVETGAGDSLAVPPALRPMAERRFGKAKIVLFLRDAGP